MTDCRRLARHLRDALLAVPLTLSMSCSQPAPAPSPPVISTTSDPTPVDGPSEPPPAPPQPDPDNPEGPERFVRPEPAFPVVSGMCGSATWCGNGDAGRSRATEASAADQCAPRFSDGDQYYALDEAKTAEHARAGDADTCCYVVRGACVVPGRPLIIDGEGILAPVARGASDREVAELDRILGEGWLADARAEHASIASFARAALELMAVGAPLDLVAECQRAGGDEVRHAELCFALAGRYLGRALTPGPLPTPPARPATIARLAADTFEEGCVGETTATLMAERALEGCTDPHVTRTLTRIVRDERRHAALAWKTIAWAVSAGGPEVVHALSTRAVACAPGAPRAPARDPRLAAHGRLDARAIARARHDAWHEIIVPTLGLLSR